VSHGTTIILMLPYSTFLKQIETLEPKIDKYIALLGTICSTGMSHIKALDKTEKVGITLPISLVKRTDNARGDIPRSTFIRKAIERSLRKEQQ
jgi:hypothetical protein